MGDSHDNFIVRGKCGHAFHFDCLNECSCDNQRCPECPERWEPSGRDNVAYRCPCGEKLLDLPVDEDKVISLLSNKASYGYAQYFLGLHHCGLSSFQIGNNKTPEVGVKLLERAVESGYVPAFRILARMHCEGICGFDQSIGNAYYLFKGVNDKELAEFLTPIEAELYLATAKRCREEGDRYNYIQFVKHAAAKGNAEAVGILGNLYLGSKLKSKAEIIQMFATAAVNGDQICRAKYRFHLANLYLEEGNIAKYIENLKWASYFGHMEAMYLVGAYYLVGLYGCKKDEDFALLYLDRARGMGHPVAQEVLSARLFRSIKLVMYFDAERTQRVHSNIAPSFTILQAKLMIQFETGLSPDAFDLLGTDGEILANDSLVDDILVDEGQPKYQRETFLCNRGRSRDIFPGFELFEACDGSAYTELKAVNSSQYLEELLLPFEHCMLSCKDPKCEACTAGFSAYSEQAQHAAICWQRASGGCYVCKRFWELAKSHVLRCTDTQCRMPGCGMWQKKKEEAMRQS